MAKYNISIPDDMMAIINDCTAGLAGVGLVGGAIAPHADLIVIAPVWVNMTIKLADKAGASLSEQTAKKIALAVFAGAGAFVSGVKMASFVFGWVGALFTMGGSVAVSAVANAAINAAFTRSYGRAAAKFFLATDQIGGIDKAMKILIALAGADYGFKTPYDNLIE